jgi:hypothetical protein
MLLDHLDIGFGIDGAKQLGYQLHQIDMDHFHIRIPQLGSALERLGRANMSGACGYAEYRNSFYFPEMFFHNVLHGLHVCSINQG